MTGQPMIAVKAPRATTGTRNRLMASGAMGMAIGALMLAPQMARAQSTVPGGQSFQGDAQVVSGGATVVQSATQDTITVTTPQAVINWTPDDRTGTGTIDFLPEGLRGLFTGDADFTVLNRIIPLDGSDIPVARMIALNGIIESQVGGQQGGNVWFYSPGGILIGGTSIINVGSLLLTSRDIDTTGGLFGPGETIRFRNPSIAGANGRIEIDVLARINARNATPGSAYVAMVAPRVVQAGTVRSDGAIALVAAEEVDIRINRGLFDIVVTTGTSDPNGIVHTGSSTGPSDTSTAFENRAYLVAVPKNQALTMLLSGTIGFETASSVSIAANGGILLSAGGNILQGSLLPPPASTGIGNISITDSRLANNFGAIASGTIVARPNQSCAPLCSATNPAGQLLFGGSATFAASNGVSISVGQAQRMSVAGNLLILSARPGQGGMASLTIDNALPPTTSTSGGGLIQVAGAILLDASSGGNPVTGVATGGTATVSVNGGTLSAAALSVLANGSAGIGTSADGANGLGGTAGVNVENGGVLNTGSLTVAADGRGSGPARDGQFNPFLTANGGNGTGGTATIVVDDASLAASVISVTANGFGAAGTQSSGDGTGGTASVRVDSDGGTTLFSAGNVQVAARGNGGGSGFDQATSTFFTTRNGGNATGGRASFAASDTATSTVSVNLLNVDARATGGSTSDSSNPPLGTSNSGDAQGGIATFALTGTATNAAISQINVTASGTGGAAISPLGNAGDGTGGSASVALATASNLQSGIAVNISADGSGGVGTDASGGGVGGSATADFASASVLNTAALRLSASGIGGGASQVTQSFVPVTTIGGDGTGGIVSVSTAGNLTITEIDLDANGFGGSSNPPSNPASILSGGDADGGLSRFIQTGGSLAAGTVDIRANATAGGSGGATGTTGTATGGTASFASSGGASATGSDLSIEAFAQINANGGGTMLAQQGGTAALSALGGSIVDFEGRIALIASAGAPGGGFADTAGLAAAGAVTVEADNAAVVSADTLELYATASGTSFGTAGGSATGGVITVRSANLGSVTTLGNITASASATAGSGDQGGQGLGGSIDLTADGGSIGSSGSIFLSADGVSGSSFGNFASPDGRGGAVTVHLTDNDLSVLTFSGVQITADGRVGQSFSSFGPSTPARGGDGIGGTVNILIEGGTLTGTSFAASAEGSGTGGGLGQGGTMNYAQSNGDVTLSFLSIGASGFGGTSPSDQDNSDPVGVGGLGQGGTVTLAFTGGSFSADFANASADGRGGNGHQGFSNLSNGEGGELFYSGDGGEGIGGSIAVTIDGAAEVASNFLSFSAEGRGGNGGSFNAFGSDASYTPGRGGNGGGGNVTIDLLGGNTSALDIAAFAAGRGGDAGQAFTNDNGVVIFAGPANHPSPDGGNGTGGNALIRLAGTTVSGSLSANASATGGEGGSILSGFTGGTGTGGLAEITIDGVTGVSVPVNIIADGRGGRGGRPNHGEGGDGGDGFGGTARLTAINGADFLFDNGQSTNTELRASGYGGDGRNGAVNANFAPVETGFSGGDGGDGRSGTIELSAIDSNLSIAAGSDQGFNTGFGGRGGDGADNVAGDPLAPTFGGNGGSGGDGYGGEFRLVAVGGTLSAGDLSLQASGQRGDGGAGGLGNVTSTTDPVTGVTTFFGGNGSTGFSGITLGGSVLLEAGETETGAGLVDVASLTIDVSGDVGGRAALVDNSSGAGIALGAFAMVNGNNGFSFCGALQLCGSGLYVSSRDGAVTIGGNVDLDLVGGFQVDAVDTGGLKVVGTLSAIVGLDIIARHEARGDGATVEAASVVLGGGPVDLRSGTLVRSTAGSINLTSGTFISFDALDSAADIFIDAGTDVTGNTLTSTTDLAIFADGLIDIGTASAGTSAILNAGGSLRVGDVTTDSGSADLVGNGVTLDSGTVATTLTVRAQNGDAVIGTVTAGAYADINALGDVSITQLTTTGLGTSGGSSAPTAAIIVNSGGTVTLGSLDSADGVFITADTLVQSAASGESIAPGGSSITAVGAVSIGTAGDIDFGSADGASISLFTTAGNIGFGTTASDFDTRMTATVGSINGTSVTTTDGDATLTAGNRIVLDNADVGDVLSLTAGLGGIALGTSISGYDTLIDSGGDVSIVSATTTDIGTTAPTSTANIVIDAVGTVSLGTLDSAENITVAASTIGGPTSVLTALGTVGLTSTGDSIVGTVDANNLTIDAGGAVAVNSAELVGGMTASAGTTLTLGTVNAGGSVALTAVGDAAIDLITTGGALDVAVTTGGLRLVQGGSDDATFDVNGLIDIDSFAADGMLSITGNGNAILDDVSGFDAVIDVSGLLTFSALDASETLQVTASQIAGLSSTVTAGLSADITTTSGPMVLGAVEAPSTTLISAGGIGFNLVRAGDARLQAQQDIEASNSFGATIIVGGSVSVNSAEGAISIGSIDANDDIALVAATDITAGTLTTLAGDIAASAGGNLVIRGAGAGGDLTTSSGGDTEIDLATVGGIATIGSLGDIDIERLVTTGTGGGQGGLAPVNGDMVITATGNVTLGALVSASDIVIDAAALLGDASIITATGDVSLLLDSTASFGTLDAGSLSAIAGNSIDFTRATTNGTNSLNAGTGITGGTQTSTGGGVVAASNGGIIAIDTMSAAFDAVVTNLGGGATLGSVTTRFGGIFVDATGGVRIDDATSAGQFDVASDADIIIGTATSFGDTILDAGTTITVTSLTTTGQTSSNSSAPTNAMIRLTADGDVNIGTLDAIGSASIDAANLVMAPASGPTPATSSIRAGEQISILVDTDATFGSAGAGQNVSIGAGGTVNFASIIAAGSASINAGLILAASSTIDADLNIFIDTDAESALGTLNGGFVSIISDVGVTFDAISGANGASLFAQRDIVGGTISTPGGTLSVTSAQGDVAITAATSGGNAFFLSSGDIALGSLNVADGSAFLDATGAVRVDLGDIADAFVSSSGGTTTIGTLTSGGASSIDADGDILITRLTTTGLGGSQNSSAPVGSGILLDAAGSVALGALDSAETITITAASLTGAESTLSAIGLIGIDTTGAAQFGALESDSGAAIIAGTTVDFSSITTVGSTTIDAGGAISGGNLRSEFGILDVTTDAGNLTLASAYAGREVDFDIGGDIRVTGALTVAAPQSEQVNSAFIRADGDVVIDNGAIGGALTVAGGGDVAFANTFAVAGDADITAGQTISVAGFATTQSTATSSTPALAGNIRLDAGSTLTLTGNVAATGNVSLSGDTIAAAQRIVQAGGNITVVGDDDVMLGSLDGAFVSVRSNETISFADILARNGTTIFAERDVRGGSIDTGGTLSVSSAEGSIALTRAAADVDAGFFAGADIGIDEIVTDFGNTTANAEGSIRIDFGNVGGNFTSFSGDNTAIGDLTSSGPASVDADGDIAITRLTTTGLGGSQNSSAPAAANILLNAGGDVTLGALDSASSISIQSTNLLSGNGGEDALASSIRAVSDILIATSNNASFGSLDGGTARIETGGSLDFGSSRTRGSTVVRSGGNITGTSLSSDFSSLDVLTQTGDIGVGTATAGANASFASGEGDIAIDTLDADGNISMIARLGAVSGTSAESSFGTILIDAATVDYGDLQSSGTILVRATGNVDIDFAQTGGEGGSQGGDRSSNLTAVIAPNEGTQVPAGSDIIVDAGGTLTLGVFNSAEDIIIDAAALSGSESALTAEGIIDIDVTGNAQFGSLTASGNQILVDAGGIIDGALVNAKGAGSATRITGNNGVTIGTIRAPGTLEVRAPGGAIIVSDVQAGSAIVSGLSADVTATAATLFTLAQATGGALTVRGTAGTLTLSDARASGALTASSSNGALVVGTAQAASIALQSDTTATLNGAVTATGALTADVRGTATINGIASGATIAIASGDIAIGATARIGTAGTTNELRLTNSNNGRQTFIGGADTTAGYSLSATELSRLFSGNITVRGSHSDNREGLVASAPGTAAIAPSGNPNVVIDSFTLTGGAASGGNLGANGTFRIEAPGFARVIGTATLNNLSNDNRFVISAERAVQLVVGQGAIRLNGVNGLAGTLLLDADDVVVATADAIADIADLTDTAAIDERLAQNDGILSDEGALSAGTIAFAVDNGVYVQNSGNGDGFDDRRGFTAGAGGVTIVTRASTSSQSSPRIVINGRIASENGTFLTGTDAFGRVTINEVALTGESQLVSGIDQGSTLNGCLIASASNCFAFQVDVIPPVQDNPLIDEEDEESEQSEGEDALSVTTVIEVTDLDPLPNEPLIDDPVTGSPNDDLWVPEGE